MKKEMIQGLEVISARPEGEMKADIVLVHGSWGGAWMWQKYLPILTNHGFAAHALSLRGHGESEGTVVGAHMDDYVEDVRTVVDALGIENPIVMGHSMGGCVVLMYAKAYGARAVVAVDASPSLEVMGEGKEMTYPESYLPKDAGMPTDPQEVMKALPDIPKEMLMNLQSMLGPESGVARSDRKRGISIPKESLTMPLLFIGAEFGKSVPFGIAGEVAEKFAQYYGGEFFPAQGATHPGVLIGEHAPTIAEHIAAWLDGVV